MSWNKRVLLSILTTFLLLALGTPGSALAWSGCGSSYVVQWGDTLSGIAAQCGTTMEALRQANPNLGYWVYAGQTLWMPGGYQGDQYSGSYYGYQGGNNCYGYQYSSNCYDYQYGGNYYGSQYDGNGYSSYGATYGGTYVVQWGDTLRKIADRMGISLTALIAANPQLWNPSLIYPGQVINLPGGSSYGSQGQMYGWSYYNNNNYGAQGSSSTYVVCRGDTLKIIAARFGTTVEHLLALNPQIWNPNWIYAGQVIRIW